MLDTKAAKMLQTIAKAVAGTNEFIANRDRADHLRRKALRFGKLIKPTLTGDHITEAGAAWLAGTYELITERPIQHNYGGDVEPDLVLVAQESTEPKATHTTFTATESRHDTTAAYEPVQTGIFRLRRQQWQRGRAVLNA